MDDAAKRRFEELKEGGLLPSPKGVSLSVLEMTRRPDASIGDLTRLVQMDPAMAGRVLRYANAARGGSLRHIASLRHAVTFLGLFRVRQIALAFTLIDQYRTGRCPAFDYTEYWSTSLAAGIAAQQLAAQAHCPPDECFTCGLLAGVGRLALATVFPIDYARLLHNGGTPQEIAGEEQARFGIDHATLSAEMLLAWGLPDIFTTAVRHHEDPGGAPFAPGSRAHTLTAVLHFAMRIGQLLNLDEARRWDKVPGLYHSAAQLGIEAGDVPALIERTMINWQDWARDLNLPTRTYPDLHALLTSPPLAASGEESGDGALSSMLVVPLRIALLVPEAQRRQTIFAALDALGLPGELAADWPSLRKILRLHGPDVAIVDIGASVDDGMRRLRELRVQSGAGLHCIALIPAALEKDAARLMLAGASDYLLYDATEAAVVARLINVQHLVSLQGAVRAVRELAVSSSGEWARTNRRLQHEALTDVLTQLPNRRYGMDRFAQEWSVATSSTLPISCMMLDIDHFKKVNDRYGHDTGDLVLRQVATAVKETCRRSDVVFRYGGEEFCIICPATGRKEAAQLGERIASAVRNCIFGNPEAQFPVTLSIGIAVRRADTGEPDDLIATADQALYRAKAEGRDRVIVAEESVG